MAKRPMIKATPSRILPATRLTAASQVQTISVPYETTCQRYSRRKAVHRRKQIPELPAGRIVGDAQPNAPLAFDDMRTATRATARAAAAKPALQFHLNTQIADLATADTASHVCEPSVAVNGKVIFATGNWFACVSTDGGTSFQYVNPYTAFPDPPGSKFCCDQVVIFSDKFDRFFWLLQYGEDNNGENVQRIAHASTADVVTGHWAFFDISSKSLGLNKCWLDFPDLAVGSKHLYMTTNAFKGQAWSERTAIVRVSIGDLIKGKISADKIVLKDIFNFRVAQNCKDTAYWGTHVTNSKIRVFAWPQQAAAPTSFDVDIPTWSESRPSYQSTTPGGANWLERVDGRIVAASLSNGQLWLGWTAGAGGVNARPHPHVQIAVIDIKHEKLAENINLWDPKNATACPALATDGNGEVGVGYCIGGATQFPTHVVGYATGERVNAITFSGARSPGDRKWGDYLAVRPAFPAKDRLIASGYTLQNGAGVNDATPNVTIFSR